MKLDTLAKNIGANVLNNGNSADIEVDRIYAGDTMSDLLNEASATTLLVTNLVNPQLIRIVDIMDVPGICFLNGVIPEPELIDTAIKCRTMIIVSPYNMFETCRRLSQYVYWKGKARS